MFALSIMFKQSMKMLDSENKLTGIARQALGWMKRAGGDVVVPLRHAVFLLKPQ